MGQYFLLIVSKEKPNLDIIIDQFGYVGEKGETKEYDNFINRICENQQWRFRLVANPTRTLRREGKRGKIVAHTSPKFQLAWLENKAIQNGFKLYDAYVLENRWKIFKKNSEQSKVKVKEVVFEGILSVDNVELFRKALIEGIGRGKVYGMGMLTIVSV
jgi:CRISPR system Cascade subunit CasE